MSRGDIGIEGKVPCVKAAKGLSPCSGTIFVPGPTGQGANQSMVLGSHEKTYPASQQREMPGNRQKTGRALSGY
jgi:hypothetical protein